MQIRRLGARLGAHFLEEGDRDPRERFYEGLCLVGAVLTLLVVVPVNAFQNLPLIISEFSVAFGLASLVMYWAATRHGRYHPGLYFALLLAILNVAWSPNAGTAGSIPYYFFVPLCYAVFFFSGVRMWLLCGLAAGNVLALMGVEALRPDLIQPFARNSDRLLDLSTGLTVSMTACVLILWVAATGYRLERQRLRKAVDALTSSERRLAQIFLLNPDAVFLFDSTNRSFLDVNDGFTRLLGWTRAEAVGRSSADLNVWVDEADRKRLNALADKDEAFTGFVTRLRARDGRIFWGSIAMGIVDLSPLRTHVLSMRDVTQEIETQRAIAESRALLSTLIDSTDDQIYLVEPVHFGLELWNQAFAGASERSFAVAPQRGLTPEQMFGRDGALWRGFFERALAEDSITVEYEPPGSDRVILHSINAVRHRDETTGVAVFGKDITERKRADQLRERHELQVREAQKMESLGSLAGGVAHDFNNMLAGIMGYADMLLDEEQDRRRREYLEAILQAANRSADLTRKLLAFGRRGKNIVESVDLNATVNDAVVMLRPSFRNTIVVDLRLESTWLVDGDPSQFNQVVLNLCLNANEAMPEGGTLDIRTSDVVLHGGDSDLAAGEYVELKLADTGVGMPDTVKERIFEPFFTTKLHGGAPGTGLGLSTVYGVVHLHHGTIEVASAPGTGTTFRVLIPRGALTAVARAAPARSTDAHGLILVVEDEELLRRFASAALSKLGYETLSAVDGEEAIQVFTEHHHELTAVLLDLKMPRKDGREAFLAFREIDAAVPVLICSGYGDNEEAQGLITLGARGLLPKPYRVAALGDMLAQVCRPATG